MEEKIARICWNTNGWKRPSGREGKSQAQKSYEYQLGYGHEEWLLDIDKIYKDGYHYGFLQPMNVKSGKHLGNTYDIHLYTISPKKQRLYIGCLHNAVGVKQDESKIVYGYYNKKGWIKEMKEQIRNIDGVVKDFTPETMFNVKFKIEDADIHTSNRPILVSTHITRHYVLQTKDFPFEFEKDEEGNYQVYDEKPCFRINKGGKIEIDPIHKKIQNGLLKCLKKEYRDLKAEMGLGKTYGQRVDISGVHKETEEIHFFEVKTKDSTKLDIREALGQILEYAHYPAANRAKKIFIIGENKPDKEDIKYLEQLRKLYNIPIWYRRYSITNKFLSDVF